MTREEAIEELIRAFDVLDFSCHMDNRRKEAFNMAKMALEQEPCGDCISRADTLKPYATLKDDDVISVWLVKKNIEQQKTVTPQKPKTGHWIYKNYNWHCSECDETPKTLGYVGNADFMKEHFKFCNHCGSRMSEASI